MTPEPPTASGSRETLFRQALDAVEDATLIVAQDGHVEFANRAASELLKRPPHELPGQWIEDVVRIPGAEPGSWGTLATELRDGHVRRGTAELVPVVGEPREVELTLQRGEEGRVIVTARTAINPAEIQRQRQAHDLQESILESIADAVIITDVAGRVQQMNRVAEQLTGYSRDAARGHRLKSIMRVFEDPAERPESITRDVVESGVVMVFGDRARLATRDDRNVSIEGVASPIRDQNSQITGVAVVFRDWTHERRARDALKRSEESFRSLSECLPVALWVTREERVVYANPNALALSHNSSLEELAGSRLVSLLHEADRETFSQHLRDEKPEFLEMRILQQDDGVAFAELASMPLTFNGKPAVVTLGRDLTERRALEAQLRVSERMVSVGTLAAGVAHEINNPLAYVLANLEQVQQYLDSLSGQLDTEALEDLRDLVSEGHQGAERVRTIVRDLGTFSRSDDDILGLVDVSQALESAIAMAQNEIRHRARLTRDYESPLPLVSANEARLAQVFLNLLMNAAQALDDGRAETNEIRVRTRRGEGEVVVEVSDTGPGVPRDLQHRIFDPFFTTKPIGEGVGLGLSICHSIISAYAGSVSVVEQSEAEGGKRWGSTFRVHLPASSALPSPLELPVISLRSMRSGRVLIVDDEPVVLKALRRILREHEVELAHSGKQALKLLLEEREHFDVIVCDMMMPEVSGLEVYQRVFSDAPALASRMLFMTGGAFTQSARDFLAQHPERWFEKPFNRERVLSMVQEVLQESGSADTSRTLMAPSGS